MMNARARLLLVALAAGGGVALLLAARPHLQGPAGQWTGTDVAIAVSWVAALGCSAWIAVVALACNVALGIRRPGAIRVAVCIAPGFVRRLAGLAIVGSSVLATTLPATAATAPTAAPEEPVVRAPAPAPRGQQPVDTPAIERTQHVVAAGDNLWQIARAELVLRNNAAPTDTQIAPYWRAVIAANRATLRSGDPNLIFVGEVIALPPRH